MRILIPLFFLLAACGSADQDKLPDDLTTAEGTANAEPEVEVEPEPEPAPPTNAIANMTEPEEDEIIEVEAPADVDMPKPSFSCEGRLNRVEALICTDPQLANLDRRLAREYSKALDEASPEQRERLTRLGRRYLADRNRCPTSDCVLQSYRWYLRDIELVMGWQSP